MRVLVFGLVASWAVACALGATPVRADSDQPTPSLLVDGLTHDAVAGLSVKGLTRGDRERVVRDLLTRYTNEEKMAEDVLGRSWQAASPEERSTFEHRFRDYMVTLCAGMIKEVPTDIKVVIKSEETHGNQVIVHSTFVESDGDTTPVDWSVATAGDGHLILTDVSADGVSLIRTMSSDFRAVLFANGGRIAALVAAMTQKITLAAVSD
jgi:ABC-type transporter MlaC component